MRFSVACLLILAASACAPALPQAGPHLPPPLIRPPSEAAHNLVIANPDAARVLAGLRNRGLVLTAGDVSRVELLTGAPGYSWRMGDQESLFLHIYPDRQSALGASRGFIDEVVTRSQIIDWAGAPHLFQCGSAVALYLGERPQALNALTNICGAPVWQR